MRYILQLLLLNFVLCIGFVNAQKIAYIRYDQLELIGKGPFRNFRFNINGVDIDIQKEITTIPIHATGFDTLYYCMDTSNCKLNNPILMKFKQGKTYMIRLNPCSFYEILPETNPLLGSVRFQQLNGTDTIVGYSTNHNLGAILPNDQPSVFQKYTASAMCSFATISVEFSQLSSFDEIHGSSSDVKGSIAFNFLHGEKICITYNNASNKIGLKIIGQK